MRTTDFDYTLPEELVAQQPVEPRDASRLMVLSRRSGAIAHRVFRDLPDLLAPGDLLVFNDTRVIPARLEGVKETGGRCELLLIERLGGEGAARSQTDQVARFRTDQVARFRAMGQASKPIRAGQRLTFGRLAAEVEEAHGEGFFTVRFDRGGGDFDEALAREGHIPLPPYIRRPDGPADRERYQTIFARIPGSAAAPTAGLHFTPELLGRLEARGVRRAWVTLHVGPGTFLPVRDGDLSAHRMHEEPFEVPAETAGAFAACRAAGGRVVCVGTTVVRTLEASHSGSGLRSGAGRTALFIQPGYVFRAADAMVTNLHLPRSTLLMLVCAFAGREQVLAAYAKAVDEHYRFYSYGDGMFIG